MENKIQHIILNTESYFGNGCVQKIGDEAVERRFAHAFIITDAMLLKLGTLRPVFASLQSRGVDFTIFDGVQPNPNIEGIQTALHAFYESDSDFLIAVGGGSAIDTAKGVSIIAANPKHGDVRSLESVGQTAHRGVCLFAVPTTAGTASEVTVDYVVTDTQKQRKFLCADDNCIPEVAFIDASMMAGMPQPLAAATGMDALTHAIEAYCSRRAWAMTDIFALKAVELIAGNLKESCSLPAAREAMALGQYLAGMAFSNCGLGACHALAHPLSAVHHIAHGVANAILLPTVMEYNAAFTGNRFRAIAKAMGVHGTANMTEEQYRKAAVDAVRTLRSAVGIPQGLKAAGASEDSFEKMAASAVLDACLTDNPRPLHKGNAVELYRQAY